MATIKDVARAAGVSITTVSHTINGTRIVSDELRGRVFKAMRELDYQPNALARGLRLGHSKTLALLLPDNSNPFFAEIARHVENVCFDRGYSVILCNTDNQPAKQHSYVQALIAKQVDGIVFISAADTASDLATLTAAGIPIVVVDRDLPDDLADVVMVDNECGGYIATEYLLSLGHQRIACITGPTQLTPSAQRIAGYRRALAEAGQTVNPTYVVAGDFQMAGGRVAMGELLPLPEPPTAVFVCNDLMAIGALQALSDAGIRVPEDVSVIGFDDISLAQAARPALTTVAQPTDEIGFVAANQLMARLQDATRPVERQRTILRTRLVVRESCARCSAGSRQVEPRSIGASMQES